MCDTQDDCGDNSDEDPTLCARRIGTVGYTRPCEDFSCKSGECLPMHLVCDGRQNCDDGSDEGKNCGKVEGFKTTTILHCFLNLQKYTTALLFINRSRVQKKSL